MSPELGTSSTYQDRGWASAFGGKAVLQLTSPPCRSLDPTRTWVAFCCGARPAAQTNGPNRSLRVRWAIAARNTLSERASPSGASNGAWPDGKRKTRRNIQRFGWTAACGDKWKNDQRAAW